MMNKRPLELYIHIPFCARKCAYCDFLSFAVPERVYQDYMDKLIEEIYGQSLCFSDWNVTSIFLGGGTPSLLPPKFIEELFAVLYGCFSIEEDAEITIEANPGTLTMEKLEVYQESGINRLSLGLQSADDQELRVLGRIHTFDDFLKSYQRARQAGFTNISVDLMSALPGQDVHSWKNTLRKVIMLKPEHISAYSLIVEEGTLFYEWYGDMGSSEGGMVRRDERKGGEREDSLARSVLPGDKKSRRMELPPLPDEDSFCSRLSSSCICRRSFRSRAPRGSSSSSTLGSPATARAMATRWRCPPESWEGIRWPNPSSCTSWSSCATLAAMASRGTFRSFRP